MIQINKEWVDDKIRLLISKLGIFKMSPEEFYFEPTDEIYRKLSSGEEKDLRYVSIRITNHLGLTYMPRIEYNWGIKMEPEVAGQAEITNTSQNIRIPFFYVGKPYLLGSILAHEMTHTFLIPRGIVLRDVNENEMFTDLSAVFLGLGKLFLNGLVNDTFQYQTVEYKLGYLPLELIVYSYKKIAEYRSIDNVISMRNLLPEAQDMVKRGVD